MNDSVQLEDIAEVCSTCYESVNAAGQDRCSHAKECCVVGENGELESVRPKPTSDMIIYIHSYTGRKFNGNYKVCRNYPPCESRCTFAHGNLELLAWNGKVKMERKCLTCSEANLFKKRCLDSLHPKESNTILLYYNRSSASFEALRKLPRNKHKMKSKSMKYMYKHSESDCHYGRTCVFPHSKVEEEVWNLLLYFTETLPELKLADRTAVICEQTDPPVSCQHVSCYGPKYTLVPIKDLCKELLECELSPECYKNRFRTLLYLEENRRQTILQDKCNGYYVMTVTHSLDKLDRWTYTGYLEPCQTTALYVENLEYASECSDQVLLTLPSQEVIMGTDISLCQRDDKHLLAVNLSPEAVLLGPLKYDSTSDKVWTMAANFCVKRSYEICHKSLEALKPNVIAKLFPSKSKIRPSRQKVQPSQCSLKNLKLDEEYQMPALRAILKCPPSAPFLLTGPFGTGKTRVIVRATYEVLLAAPHARVLISVHHNQTATTYIDDYFGQMALSHENPLFNAVARVVSTDKRIPNSRFSCLYRTYNDPNVQYIRVVITTCTVAGMLARVRHVGMFSHIFVDEAAQPIEPEAVMPLSMAGPETCIVLAGDHLQCGPRDTVRDPEAGNKGLYTSLLERLHTIYVHEGKSLCDCTASLSTNYRCDAAILRLPSILLYECSLLPRAKDSVPHPKAPYPVLFICSSMDKSQTNMKASDPDEARRVVESANRYLCQWPDCWGTFYADQVCILARTHQQQNVIRGFIKQTKLAPRQGHLRESQVRVTFAIQGLEFRVVFLSTHEPREYDESGKLLPCLDMGGTVVNHRVFNTMITRTKSLFVAVGNPFYLLDAEENLAVAGNQTALCWREFIKTCINNKSIVYPEACSPDQRTEMLERVFAEPSVATVHTEKKMDSILEKSKKDMREKVMKWLTQSGVQLYRGNWILGPHGCSNQHSSDRERHKNEKAATHILLCTKPGEAKAEPLHSSEVPYRIVGLKNRQGALDEALVKVEELPLSMGSTAQQQEPRRRLGKVVQVVQQGPLDTFMCRVDPFNSNLMIPLNPKDPKLYNLPHISRVMMNEEKEQRKGAKQPRTGKHEFKPVVCFDKDSLTQEQDNPRIRDVIPFQDAKNMLFLVMFIRWGTKFYFPLGAVVDVFPAGHSLFHAQRILKAQYDIPQSCDKEMMEYKPHACAESVFPESDFPFAFTIDKPGSVTLDDALSLKRISTGDDREVFEFAVHITSVASNEKALELLETAKEKGCTVYQPYKGRTKRYSMLPQEEAQSMSLDVGCVQKCITVVGNAEITSDGLSVSGHCETFMPRLTTVCSTARLFYNDVEKVLDGRADDNPASMQYTEHPPLNEKLRTLYLISQHLKAMRLKDSCFFSDCHKLPERQDQDSKDYPQASAMVEQFMIWANWKVAAFLSRDVCSYVPLRYQPAPSADQLHEIEPQVRQALQPYNEQRTILPEEGMIFLLSTIKQLLSCLERADESGHSDGKRIIMAQQNHPQLTVALGKWRSNQRRAEYCIVEDEQKIEQHVHFSLNCIYTHFSSPLRRCFDILVQMAILNKLGEKEFALSVPEARSVAHICNVKVRKATFFEREAQQVELAIKYFQSSFACSCYVESQQGHFLTVAFSDPALKDLNRDSCHVSLDALKYTPQRVKRKEDNDATLVHATWKYKVCCLNSTLSPVEEYQLQLPAGCSPISLVEDVSVVHSYTVESHMTNGEAQEYFKRSCSIVAQSLPSVHLNNSQWLPMRDIIRQPNNEQTWQSCAEKLLESKEHAQAQSMSACDQLYASTKGSQLIQTGSIHSFTNVDDLKVKMLLNDECRHADVSSCNSDLKSTIDGDSVSSSDQDSPSHAGGFLSTKIDDRYNARKLPLGKAHEDSSCKRVLESTSDDESSLIPTTNQQKTQSLSDSVAFQVFEVARSIGPADPLHVWVGTSVRSRIISPCIQLVQPVPGLDLCVQHGQWPEECFSDPVLPCASQTKYHGISEYVDHWEPLLLAEAATITNKEHDLLFLKDVALKFCRDAFFQPCTALEEPHFVYKKDADITLTLGSEFVEHSALFFPFHVGNFVCARYEVHAHTRDKKLSSASSSPLRAIFHMVIKAVEDVEDAGACPLQESPRAHFPQHPTACAVLTAPKDAVGLKPKKVTFKFVGERNSMFPSQIKEELQGGQHTCTMQLIPCPTPMRRMYRVLLSLKNDVKGSTNELAMNIACGDITAVNKGKPIAEPTILAIVGKKKKQTDKSSKFWIEGGKPASYCLWAKRGLMSEQLNEQQWLAVQNAMCHRFTLIQGPPGTGKSVTGAHLALAFVLYNDEHPPCAKPLPGKQKATSASRPVMYCAPSNKAVDRVLDILHVLVESKYLKRPLCILRLYSKAVEHKSYPGPFADKKVFLKEDTDQECPSKYNSYALHHIIRQPQETELCTLEAKFKVMHSRGLTPGPKLVAKHRTLLYNTELHTLRGKSAEPMAKQKAQEAKKTGFGYDIVMCTCNEAASHRVIETIRPAQCIIDEAAMATEPESMIPINLSDHVVLIGDHKQLQPVIMCRGARENGLSVSLFQRYYTDKNEEHKEYFTMLTEQYRMHQAICELPSQRFYDGHLTTHFSVDVKYDEFMKVNSTLRHTFWEHNKPIMFCRIVGEEDSWKEGDEKVALQSKTNKIEASHVMFIVKHLLIKLGVKAKIAVLTFYKGQKRQLEKLWKEMEDKFPQLKRLSKGLDQNQSLQIRTVSESQGDEFDIVFLSTVRSLPDGDYDESMADRRWLREHLGFVTNPHQICVGITRAKFGLIIVGNDKLLRMDQDTWKGLIQHYEDENCLKDHTLWPVRQRSRAV